eukprot:5987330-Pyramimonas_sp.AAC.1
MVDARCRPSQTAPPRTQRPLEGFSLARDARLPEHMASRIAQRDASNSGPLERSTLNAQTCRDNRSEGIVACRASYVGHAHVA